MNLSRCVEPLLRLASNVTSIIQQTLKHFLSVGERRKTQRENERGETSKQFHPPIWGQGKDETGRGAAGTAGRGSVGLGETTAVVGGLRSPQPRVSRNDRRRFRHMVRKGAPSSLCLDGGSSPLSGTWMICFLQGDRPWVLTGSGLRSISEGLF